MMGTLMSKIDEKCLDIFGRRRARLFETDNHARQFAYALAFRNGHTECCYEAILPGSRWSSNSSIFASHRPRSHG